MWLFLSCAPCLAVIPSAPLLFSIIPQGQTVDRVRAPMLKWSRLCEDSVGEGHFSMVSRRSRRPLRSPAACSPCVPAHQHLEIHFSFSLHLCIFITFLLLFLIYIPLFKLLLRSAMYFDWIRICSMKITVWVSVISALTIKVIRMYL